MELLINSQHYAVSVDPERSLLWVIRNELGLTGSKYGCGEGQCGACTVLIDGAAHRSCITPVASAKGKAITTIEGIADGEHLHAVQEAFIDCDAMQCGYCTSGMVVSAVALLRTNPAPTEAAIRQALAGNLCRCGAYNRIVAAVQKASHTITAQARAGQHA